MENNIHVWNHQPATIGIWHTHDIRISPEVQMAELFILVESHEIKSKLQVVNHQKAMTNYEKRLVTGL